MQKTFPYRAECTLYIPEPLINLNENCKRGVGLLLFKASEEYTKGEFRRPLARVLLKYNGLVEKLSDYQNEFEI